jgi:hypothetical protein
MKEESQKALEILKDYQNRSNKELIFAMDYIKKDFDLTKESVIKLTHHLDRLEKSYEQLLKEYNSRNNITNP